jgi:hypothetical protein
MSSQTLEPTHDGNYKLRLPPDKRSFLAEMAPHMREVFASGDDPALDRLLPVAYPDDPDRQTEYRLLIHDELMESHLGALAVLEETAGADQLNEDQVVAWLKAINQVRLVMGSRLDVSEEGDERPTSVDDPRLPGFDIYDFLSALQEDILEAMAGSADD